MTLKRMFKKSGFRALAVYLVFAMTLITVVPHRADAGTIPTRKSIESAAVPGDFDRQAEINLIMSVLNSRNGLSVMKDAGVDAATMQGYLNRLSDAQINTISSRVKADMPPGGDSVSGILWGVITVLVILLLVFIFLDITGLYKLPFRRG